MEPPPLLSVLTVLVAGAGILGFFGRSTSTSPSLSNRPGGQLLPNNRSCTAESGTAPAPEEQASASKKTQAPYSFMGVFN